MYGCVYAFVHVYVTSVCVYVYGICVNTCVCVHWVLRVGTGANVDIRLSCEGLVSGASMDVLPPHAHSPPA